MEKINGEVQAVSAKNRSILFLVNNAPEGSVASWIKLGDKIQMQWVQKGPAEATYDSEAQEITFIKCSNRKTFGQSAPAPGQPAIVSTPSGTIGMPPAPVMGSAEPIGISKEPIEMGQPMPPASDVVNQMNTMAAMKYASLVYSGTGKENEADFKRLSDECLEFIEKGLWIQNERI